MVAQDASRARRVGPDGITRDETPGGRTGAWLVVGAGLFTVLCVASSLWLLASPEATDADGAGGDMRAAGPVHTPLPEARTGGRRPVLPRGPVPTAGPALMDRPALPAEEEQAVMDSTPPSSEGPSGLALFPAPGTKPLRRGIVVPEDFPLPPGFVRHYQTTDDGERLEAILLFHPDHTPVDASGAPLPVPEGRVVPPELAPPGLPIRMLALPGDAVPGDAVPGEAQARDGDAP